MDEFIKPVVTQFSEKASKKEKLKRLKTFCPLPWMHLSVSSIGKTRLCCNADEKTRYITDEHGQSVLIPQIKNIDWFLNLPFYKNIRKQMLENRKPEACSTCYALEEYGSVSYRQQFNLRWKEQLPEFLDSTKQDGSLKKAEIKYLDLPLGNLCNLRCRMCHPVSSIQMKKDFDHLKIDYGGVFADSYSDWTEDPDLYRKLEPALKTCEEIFFTGGEPLMIKAHEQILKQAIALKVAKNIRIKYNSNLTKLSMKLMDLWRPFREVEFNCSIDGIGKVNDYIRFPSRWPVIEEAMEKLDRFSRQHPHIKVYIHSTFQALNLFNIPDFLKWTMKSEWKTIHRLPHFIWLHEPKWFRSTVLPAAIKNKAIGKIERVLKKTESFFMNYNESHHGWSELQLYVLKGYLKRLKNTDQEKLYFNDFVHYTKGMDSFRKQSVTRIVPEFRYFFDSKNRGIKERFLQLLR